MTSLSRPWQNLKFGRMVFGLAAAPLAPLLPSVLALGLFMLNEKHPPSFAIGLTVAIVFALAAELWSILSGLAWLYTVARWRGKLGRLGSIAMGSVCAFLFPIVTFTCGALIFESDFATFMKRNGMMAIALGFPAVLAGALGGWIFWRLSVRPAAPPASAMANIFD